MNKALSGVCGRVNTGRYLLFSIAFLGCGFPGHSQNPWLNTSPVKFGYGVQNWTVSPVINNFRYTQADNNPANSGSLNLSSNNSFTYTRFPLVFESIGKHFYFSTNATGAIDLLSDLNGYEIVGDDDTEAQRFELIPTKLAFGGWIRDRIGLFAGAQYAYSRMIFSDDDVPDMLMLGGHQRGFHGLAMLNLNRLLVKGTFMYDWVSNSRGASQGNAQTVDLEVYYALGKRRIFGLWAGLSYQSIFSPGPEGTPTEEWSNQGIQRAGGQSYDLPDLSGDILYIRGGLYILLFQLRSYDWQNTE